ncbi:MAG: two-component regulator propeller domain-containing protein, partial [bacterium]
MRYTAFVILLILSSLLADWQTFSDYNQIYSLATDGTKLFFGSIAAIIEMDTSGNYRVYNNLNGLAGLEISTLKVDSSQRIWYGSKNGGFGFLKNGKLQNFFEFMKNGLGINDIFVDSNEIWVATSKGVSLFVYKSENSSGELKENYFKLGSFPSEYKANTVSIIGETVYVGTDNGVAVAPKDYRRFNLVNPASWKNIRTSTQIYGITKQDDSIICLGGNGIFRYSGDTLINIGLANFSLKKLVVFEDTVFVGGTSGVFKKVGTSFSRVQVTLLPHQKTTDMIIFNRKLYTSHEKGYGFYANGKILGMRFNAPMGRFFTSFAVDKKGRIWTTGRNWSISMYDGKSWRCGTTLPFDFTAFNELYYFPDTITRAYTLEIDRRDNIWCGTWGDGLFVINELDNYIHITSTNSPLEPAAEPSYIVVSAIKTDPNGNVWVANFGAPNVGLLVYKDGNISSEPVVFRISSMGLSSNLIYSLEASGTKIWIGLRDGGIIMLDHKGTIENQIDDIWRNYTTADGLPSNTVKSICIGKDGKLYIATSGGVARLDTTLNLIEQIQLPLNFSLDITSISCDRYGNIWMGSTSGAAVKFSSENRIETIYSTYDINVPYSLRSGLLSNIIYSIYADTTTNNIMFGVEGGISIMKGTLESENELGKIKIYPNPFIIVYGTENKLTIKGVP